MSQRLRNKKDYVVTSVSFPDPDLLAAGKKRAADQRITFSQYINQLLSRDLGETEDPVADLALRVQRLERDLSDALKPAPPSDYLLNDAPATAPKPAKPKTNSPIHGAKQAAKKRPRSR